MFLLLFSLCVFGKLLPGLARDIAAKNQKLLTQEIESLNSSQSHLKPLILTIPAGDWFIQGPLVFDNVINMQIHLEGNILFLDNYDTFPLIDGAYQDLWSFNNSHFVSFIGKGGIIDGNGFEWWKQSLLGITHESGLKSDDRPKLLTFRKSTNLAFTNVRMKNSPFWHLNLDDVANVTVDNLEVYCDTDSQGKLKREAEIQTKSSDSVFSLGDVLGGISLFPLNTDGIDPAGINITIRNFTYRGYDDAIAVKPQSLRSIYSRCTSDLLLDGANVTFSTGMAIGSVSTRPWHNCIDNVTIRNVQMLNPIKGIYIKSNPQLPDQVGSGQMTNILMENFNVSGALWWPIYIGPQQQIQPNGVGPGCFDFPLHNCQTNNEMVMANITLRNIIMTETAWPFAGAIRANSSIPATGFLFDNVRVTGGLAEFDGYKCENIVGSSTSNTFPKPCF